MLAPTPVHLTPCTLAVVDDAIPYFGSPAAERRKVTAAFDGGRLTLDGGVMLLSVAERRLGIAERLARLFPDRRDPTRVVQSYADMNRARILAICCDYEDADDLDSLSIDPAFDLKRPGATPLPTVRTQSAPEGDNGREGDG